MNRATSVALAWTQSPPRPDRPLAVVEPGMPVRRHLRARDQLRRIPPGMCTFG
jgi:hypothetical protein